MQPSLFAAEDNQIKADAESKTSAEDSLHMSKPPSPDCCAQDVASHFILSIRWKFGGWSTVSFIHEAADSFFQTEDCIIFMLVACIGPPFPHGLAEGLLYPCFLISHLSSV